MAINKYEDLRKDMEILKDAVAKCRREEQAKDHDVVIKITERVNHHSDEIKKCSDTMVDISDKLTEVSGNLNIMADKISVIVSKDNRRSNNMYSIIVGVIITLLSAILIYMFSSSMKQLYKEINKESSNKTIIDKL